MRSPPAPVFELKLHVPALVTRLPVLPAISVEPSSDDGGGGGGGGDDGIDGLDEVVQSEPFHSNHCPCAVSA